MSACMELDPEAGRMCMASVCPAATARHRAPLRAQDDSLGWMELRFASEPVSLGDHDVVLCEVTDWHTPAPAAAAAGGAAKALYTGHLRQLGLMA